MYLCVFVLEQLDDVHHLPEALDNVTFKLKCTLG